MSLSLPASDDSLPVRCKFFWSGLNFSQVRTWVNTKSPSLKTCPKTTRDIKVIFCLKLRCAHHGNYRATKFDCPLWSLCGWVVFVLFVQFATFGRADRFVNVTYEYGRETTDRVWIQGRVTHNKTLSMGHFCDCWSEGDRGRQPDNSPSLNEKAVEQSRIVLTFFAATGNGWKKTCKRWNQRQSTLMRWTLVEEPTTPGARLKERRERTRHMRLEVWRLLWMVLKRGEIMKSAGMMFAVCACSREKALSFIMQKTSANAPWDSQAVAWTQYM